MISTLLAGRYRIDAKLGEGGMGVVYRAHDTVLDRPVAIKVLSPQVVGAGAERLLREARSIAQLDHPHIVAVHDAGEVDGQPFIVMQLVGGKSLRDVSVSLEEALTVARQVCLALEYAHGKGLIHRDIKPENIMVADGTAKVMDFGLARSEGRTRLTQAEMIVGTVAYMAPELVRWARLALEAQRPYQNYPGFFPALGTIASLALAFGSHLDEAKQGLDRAEQLAEIVDSDFLRARLSLSRAVSQAQSGAWDDAVEAFGRSIAVTESLHLSFHAAWTRWVFGRLPPAAGSGRSRPPGAREAFPGRGAGDLRAHRRHALCPGDPQAPDDHRVTF